MTFSSNFEDFFNMDLLSSAGSSSRSSSRSPTTSFSHLPPTPPQPAVEADSLFNFQLDDDYLKVDPLASLSSAPYDFLGSLHSHTPDSSSAASLSPSYQFAIDPALVGTPAPSKAHSEFDDDENHPDDDQDDDDLVVAPVKVGGKGKARKGTVQSGGVVKKSAAAKEKKDNEDKDLDGDDWRPSPEEYARMSSKEKRQLRNKISARNFRVRRKEYIHTLEGDIAERDRLIDAIRHELGSTKSENDALRQEVNALKKAMLEGRASPMLPPPGPLSPLSPVARTSPLVTLNTQKDLPTSPRMGSRAFWGGSQSFGGITPVHTTLIPDFSISPILSNKPPAPPKRAPALQENMNPALNAQPFPLAAGHGAGMAGFDAFAEINPFTLKTLDAYRMQLWGKMALQYHQREQQQATAQQLAGKSTQPSAPLSGLASGLRPHYFTSKTASPSTPLASLLSGKPSSSSAYPSPPSSPATRHTVPTPQAPTPVPTPQHALLASLASQTLLQKMGTAFWDAFSGAPGAPAAGGSRVPAPVGWDAEKVRKVLEGTAVLRVVDVEPTRAAPKVAPAAAADALEESMRSLSLGARGAKTEEKDVCFFGKLRSCPSSIALKKA